MQVASFEWDDGNLLHATEHGASVREIEQAVRNAARVGRHPRHTDRRIVVGRTDGGRPLKVIVQLLGRGIIRPITAWDVKKE